MTDTEPYSRVKGLREAWPAERARLEAAERARVEAANTPQGRKVRENKLRRTATRRGLTLQKCPRRDVNAIGYGTYMLLDTQTRAVVAMSLPDGYGLDLDATERLLGASPFGD